jgi:hypothetical protein
MVDHAYFPIDARTIKVLSAEDVKELHDAVVSGKLRPTGRAGLGRRRRTRSHLDSEKDRCIPMVEIQ